MTSIQGRVDKTFPGRTLESEASAVAVSELRKAFGKVVAIESLSLEITSGSTYMLLGPNGSGKTTLIRILGGVLRPTKGIVQVLGLDPYRHPDLLAGKVGIAYEHQALPSWCSARDFLEFSASSKGLPDTVVDEVGNMFALLGYWEREIGTYSAGMRKRVVLAQAWLGNPPLVILDEPFSNLDSEGRDLLADLLADRETGGRTNLVATHLAELGAPTTHLGIMLNGKVEATGSIESLGERYGVQSILLQILDPIEAVRILLSNGIHPISISEDGLAVRGNAESVNAALRTLRENNVEASVAGTSHDLWAIYRTILLGSKRRGAARMTESE